ncbi:hypothetical protein ACVCNH_25325 [Achromobacter anxifer]
MNAATTRIPVERRFPLTLKQSITSIRELYETGKQQRWAPETDIPWASLDLGALDAQVRDAARLTWSRRAWVEYAGLSETPALLVRLCLESGRESDPKYFLTVRNTEEAWQIECFHRYATLLGGYLNRPPSPRQEAIFNQCRHRQVLDAACNADAFFTTHAAVEDGLELELFRAYLENAREPVARRILEQCVQAKERHATFGWLYVAERAAAWSDADRAAVAQAVSGYLNEVELRGYHCPWLAEPDGPESRANALTAEAGLGAASAEREYEVLWSYLETVTRRLAEFGVELPGIALATRRPN